MRRKLSSADSAVEPVICGDKNGGFAEGQCKIEGNVDRPLCTYRDFQRRQNEWPCCLDLHRQVPERFENRGGLGAGKVSAAVPLPQNVLNFAVQKVGR